MSIDVAVRLLQNAEWCQGQFGVGLLKKDIPEDTSKPLPKPHEVYPWSADVVHLYKMSALGALCRAHMQPPNGPEIAQSMMAVRRAIAAHGCPHDIEAWNDTPNRTKEDVIALLMEALQYVDR